MDKEKLEKMTSDLRKKAVAVEQALSEAKKRKKAEEAKPQFQPVDYEEQINSDKDVVRAALLLRDYDSSKTYGEGVSILTEEQRTRLVASFDTEEKKKVVDQAWRIYHGSLEYWRFIIGLKAQWQKVVAEMATLLSRWTAADEVASGMTTMLNNLLNDKEICFTGEGAKESLIRFIGENFESSLEDSPYSCFFHYNSEKKAYEADIFTDEVRAGIVVRPSLYSAILKKREKAIYQLQALKSAVEPFSDFLYSEVTFATGEETLPLWFIPQIVEQTMEYPDAVDFMREPQNLKYFAYRIRQRKEAGETITPEEEKRAVIPDYNQEVEDIRHHIQATKRVRRIFKEFITDGKGSSQDGGISEF